jgi:hypothetical protein
MEYGSSISSLVSFLLFFGLWLWSGIWAANDARRRGKHPVLVALLIMLAGWPGSILVWIAFRPDVQRPPFNLDDFRVK